MNINEILKGFKCSCGKEHTCSIEEVYIESGAAERLSEVCREYENILVVADENTFSAAGKEVLKNLDGKNVKTVIFPGNEILIPDEQAIKTDRKSVV